MSTGGLCGIEALAPRQRALGPALYPIRYGSLLYLMKIYSGHLPCCERQKLIDAGEQMAAAINTNAYEPILQWTYRKLGVDPTARPLILTEPQSMVERDRVRLCEILFENMDVPAVYLKAQPLLAMYSYGTTSGVIVDIGDRTDVVAFDQGFTVERADSHLRWGGQEITDSMSRTLTESGHRFYSPVEGYIARLVKERVAFVASNFEEALIHERELQPSVVDVRRYGIPDGTKAFSLGSAMFRVTEGLFQPNLWGKDSPGLHELVAKAIQAASIDIRRSLCRSIYLSGGTSILSGLDERLRKEVQALVPASSQVKVHASPFRLHAAYRGAGILSTLGTFESMCVWRDDWNEVNSSFVLSLSLSLSLSLILFSHTRRWDHPC